MIQIKSSQSGFALLITLLLLAVIITVTLSIVELTIRQVRLSIDGREAEIAFQAASAGVECAQRMARTATTTIFNGTNLQFDCFQQTNSTASTLGGQGLTVQGPTSTVNSRLRRYTRQITWNNRCTEIDLIVVSTLEDDLTLTNIQNAIVAFPEPTLRCFAGSTCHIVATAGYNVPCAQINNLGVLKREMLLEF